VPVVVLAAWVLVRNQNPVQKRAFWITADDILAFGMVIRNWWEDLEAKGFGKFLHSALYEHIGRESQTLIGAGQHSCRSGAAAAAVPVPGDPRIGKQKRLEDIPQAFWLC